MGNKGIVIFILIAFFLFMASSAKAVALRVWPSEIEIKTEPGILVEKELNVENVGRNVALFEVYPDNFSDWIDIRPESFSLESGESRKVVLRLNNKEKGIFSTMISVVAKPLSQRQFKAGSGIKVPLEIRISGQEKEMFLAALSSVFSGEVLSKSLVYILAGNSVLILIIILLLRQRGV